MKKRTHQPSVVDHPIVAIDLGTTAVRAMAARKQPDGTLHILGLERIAIRPDKVFKKSGIIYDTTEATAQIRRSLLLLGNRIRMPEKLVSAFVTIEGKDMQVVMVNSKRDQINKKPITDNLLDSMEKECIEKIEAKYPEYTVVDVEPQLFVLDEIEQTERPSSEQKARRVEGRYIATVCKALATEKIETSYRDAGSVIEQRWAASEALVTALTNEDDSETGCAIINMGAQTTTLIIYKDDHIQKIKVIPLGGYHITNDITALNISFANAEKIKTLYGKALEKQITHNQTLGISSTKNAEKVKVTTTFLAHIIQMRLSEIMQPIMNEINDCSSSISKVYVTGGGAMLDGLIEYLQEMTSLPVDYGTHSDWLSEDEQESEYFKPEYSTLIGTLALGADYRETHTEMELLPLPWNKRIKQQTEQFVCRLFTPEQEEQQ